MTNVYVDVDIDTWTAAVAAPMYELDVQVPTPPSISIGLPGPTGPPGPPGADSTVPGPPGATGPQGPQGPTGATGSQGPQGNPGTAGASGSRWWYGTTNPSAALGVDNDFYLNTSNGQTWTKVSGTWTFIDNLTGPQGPQGIQGVQGVKGDTGTTGAQGPKGDTGATGATGPPGADSTVPGPAGPTGSQGVKGDTGAQGVKGDTGAQGPPGATGATGSQGPAGATGAQGPKGDTGATGGTGPQGPPGAGVPPGGTDGNVLTKVGTDNYVSIWAAPTGGGGGTGTPSNTVTNIGSTGGAGGSVAEYSRGDHRHGMTYGTPVDLNPGTSNSVGAASAAANAAHTHGMDGFAYASTVPATPNVVPPAVGSAGSIGTLDEYARSDHTHQGAALETPPTTVVTVDSSGASAGSSVNSARADHQHLVSSGSPANLGPNSVNAMGAAGAMARAAHVHGMSGFEATASKGVASGYAGLDGTSKVPIAQVPTGTSGSTVALGHHTHAYLDQAAADTRYVNVSGDTMTAALTVPEVKATGVGAGGTDLKLTPPTDGWINASGAVIGAVGTPSNPQDAANKSYVDTVGNEVAIQTAQPADTFDLWVDTDEDYPLTGYDEVIVQPNTPPDSYELWVDTDEDPTPVETPYGRIYRAANQSITPSTITAIQFDTTDEVSGFTATGLNTANAALVVPKTGLYHVIAHVALAGGPTAGQLVHFGITRNGAEDYVNRIAAAVTMNPCSYEITGYLRLTVNDTIGAMLFIGTGTTNIQGATGHRLDTSVQAMWMRP
jgi:hypothetical protein